MFMFIIYLIFILQSFRFDFTIILTVSFKMTFWDPIYFMN